MDASGVASSVLGVAFDKLYLAVVGGVGRVVAFSSDFERLKLTLQQIKPTVEDIEKLNKFPGSRGVETETLIKQLRDGEALIEKCLKVKRVNICNKWRYSRKLEKWEKSLAKLLSIDVQIQNFRDSKKILVEMKSMQEQVEEFVVGVRNLGINQGNVFPGWVDVPAVPDDLVGFDIPLLELKEMVLKNEADDEAVVVISAPGGCGKTTLVKLLCLDQQIRDTYKHICFATVSRTPSLRNIIHKIFNKLSNGLVPDCQSDEDALNQLQHLLQGHLVRGDSMLLVLDDVWKESLSVLEKLIFPIQNYKILVTTRCEFPRFKHTYKLQLLPDHDAMDLFRRYAFRGEECKVRKELVDKVVKSCGGLPLALKVVGRSLCGESEFIWKSRIEKQSEILFPSGSDLLDRLQPSIDALDGDLKDCYQDLGLFLEDQRITVAVLLDMWMERYNHDDFGNKAFVFLLQLAAYNLVDLAFRRKGDPASIAFSNAVHYARQHDVLRELAIYQSAKETIEKRSRLNIGNDFPPWLLKQTSLLLQVQMLSISTDEALFSNVYDLQLPNLEVLLLNIQTSSYTLPMFMKKARRLKVLAVTNNGLSPTMFSNSDLLDDLHNLKRITLEHISFSSICQSTFKLGNLQKISLVMCKVGDAFQDCVVRMPNLLEINIEYCDDLEKLPIGICDLVHLRKLSISYCQKLVEVPEELGKLKNLEVLMLHSCSNLTGLPDSIERLCKLCFLDIYDCVDLNPIPEKIWELRSLKTIFMGGRQGLYDLPDTVLNLAQLESVICDEETALLWEGYKNDGMDLRISIVKDDMNLNWLHRSSCLGNL